jgi:hypothetical protein
MTYGVAPASKMRFMPVLLVVLVAPTAPGHQTARNRDQTHQAPAIGLIDPDQLEQVMEIASQIMVLSHNGHKTI